MPSAPALHTPAPAQAPAGILANALEAVDQLEKSERGRRAAVAFRRLLEANNASAFSLDNDNWRALETLVRACKLLGASKIYAHLPTR